MDDPLVPFPELPVDLVFLIIATFLEMEPKRAREFVLLSKEIKPIAERALYQRVLLHGKSVSLFADMIKSTRRPDSFYQNNARTLCLLQKDRGLPAYILCSIFSKFSAIQTLGMPYWDDFGMINVDADLDTLFKIRGPRPTKISCSFRWALYHRDSPQRHRFAFPFFQSVTHLQLCDRMHRQRLIQLEGKYFHCLPKLTHLSIVLCNTSQTEVVGFLPMLSLAESIVVCIIIMAQDTYGRELVPPFALSFEDPRVVFLLANSSHQPSGNLLVRNIFGKDFLRQWGDRLEENETDMWDDAERIVEVQRSQRKFELLTV
ncbi:hypothetical protein C8J56DRAFT_144927 [Mycena floridula]|nr:hypothetical protein C8J56DRAFT_144927 [Mycena floridula]